MTDKVTSMKNIDDLKAEWNKQADRYNQWDELGVDEIVHFAQQVALSDAAKKFELASAPTKKRHGWKKWKRRY